MPARVCKVFIIIIEWRISLNNDYYITMVPGYF